MRQTHASCNVTMGTKLQGTHSPELALRSTDFCAPENLIYPALKLCTNTKRDFILFAFRHRKIIYQETFCGK